MKIKDLLLKLKNLLISLFRPASSLPVVEEEEETTQVQPEVNTQEPIVVQPVLPEVVPPQQEPDVTDPKAMITSFLWKPLSDTNPKVTVITVACDAIRSEDLFVEVLDNKDLVMKGKKDKNPGSPRGNTLPGCKFGRINFKPGLLAADYAKHQPLKVRFYIMLNKVRTEVTIQGKPFATIKDATVRWVMHNGRMSIDIKK